MKQLYIFFKTILPVVVVALILALPNDALADQAKSKSQVKGFSGGVRSALTSLRSKKVYTGKTASTSRMIADTTTKITSIGKNASGIYNITVNLADDASQLQINVYNILGRKLVDVWKGDVLKGEFKKEIPTEALPEGMYICVVQGKDFRLAEKFIISR